MYNTDKVKAVGGEGEINWIAEGIGEVYSDEGEFENNEFKNVNKE